MRTRRTRRRADGGITRRFQCAPCGTSETHKLSSDAERLPPDRRFDVETIMAIKASVGSQKEIGLRFGCSPAMVGSIRRGEAYRDLWDPGLTPGSVSCHGCVHWSDGGCTLDFAEPIKRGPGFARECAAYWEKRDSL
jgi:hypothetical protein